MTILETSVSRFSLTVDVSDTVAVMIDNADTPWGRRLHEALALATSADTAYAVTPYVSVGLDDFRPDAPQRPDRPDVADCHVSGVLGKLAAARYLTARTELRESSSESYLSDGRTVTSVAVHRPFALVEVDYWLRRDANRPTSQYGYAYARRWEISHRSHIVPAGLYLIGETGDHVPRLTGVAGVEANRTDLVSHLFDLEGFGASTCDADCDACGAQWRAECGSWHFRAEDCPTDAWYFDDAAGIDDTTGTIACPACRAGRVGFAIS
ncbi:MULTISPECIES: hypothetical protein [unclassified Crossiella]|uniref:hypothetical protein n=1 Tax=unclassified Crossiella TaxID=2620835 RepID=UPI001FFF8BE0|nr:MULTISPECIES: hypothetical protein [unclassified Crossiella]MCK2239771.1 hypothetical protein [Crossiella sp. S99.2]MCK2252466.1 hypothetical protein [Crossiella sp. S99.1]